MSKTLSGTTQSGLARVSDPGGQMVNLILRQPLRRPGQAGRPEGAGCDRSGSVSELSAASTRTTTPTGSRGREGQLSGTPKHRRGRSTSAERGTALLLASLLARRPPHGAGWEQDQNLVAWGRRTHLQKVISLAAYRTGPSDRTRRQGMVSTWRLSPTLILFHLRDESLKLHERRYL